MSFLSKLVGKRTQIIALALFVLKALSAFGVVPTEISDTATDLLTPLGVATLAAKIGRI